VILYLKKIFTIPFCNAVTAVKYSTEGVFIRIKKRGSSFSPIISRELVL